MIHAQFRVKLQLTVCCGWGGDRYISRGYRLCFYGGGLLRREGGLMEGHAAVGPASSTFVPMEKNRLWRPPKVSPLRGRAGKGPARRLLVCTQSFGNN